LADRQEYDSIQDRVYGKSDSVEKGSQGTCSTLGDKMVPFYGH